MKIEIKSRFTGRVLFTHDAENNTICRTLEVAVAAHANLGNANLGNAYLEGAYLGNAYLEGAYLGNANLGNAYLEGAYLEGANLGNANLGNAYLEGANLEGANLGNAYLGNANLGNANLEGAYLGNANLGNANLGNANLGNAYLEGAYLEGGGKLVGARPIFQLGPIGSRCTYFVAYLTDKGLRLRAGCFFGDRVAFEKKLAETHEGDSVNAQEYLAALALIDMHVELWGGSRKRKR